MKTNERGSALVLVIFTLSMLMILAVAMASSLLVNYKMKQSEMLKEQELYVDQACMVYTQAYLENAVNTAVLTAIQEGFVNVIRLDEEPDDEYEGRVLAEATSIYNTKLTAAESKFPTELADQMLAVQAANYSSFKQLSGISPNITDCDFKNGTCSVTYTVTIDSESQIFNAKFTWNPYSALNKACSSIVTGGSDIDYIKVSTIYG